MATSQRSLNDFLTKHCETKPIKTGAGATKDRCYVFNTEDCLLFMAEQHVEEMRKAVDQTDEVMAAAKESGDFNGVIMTYNWDAPEPGMDTIRIPVKLVESLDDKRALMLLRSLEGIQRDIDEGRSRKASLQALFGDVATVKTFNNLEGERSYLITGTVSAKDKRGYAERFAEHVATNVLFDLPKALNARLQTIVPKEARGKFFIEGRDMSSKKIRYGAEAQTELILTDEGAAIYTDLAKKNSDLRETITSLFQQAITDPFGLSLKHYMGKHAVIKLAPTEEEEVEAKPAARRSKKSE